MKPIFATTRIFLDEDTTVEEQREIAILWSTVIFVEDVTYLWPGKQHVTSLTLETEEKVHILETFNTVINKWDAYLKWIDRITLIGIN